MRREDVEIDLEVMNMIMGLPTVQARGAALDRIVDRTLELAELEAQQEAPGTAANAPTIAKSSMQAASGFRKIGRPSKPIDTAELLRLRNEERRSFPEIAARLKLGVGTVHRAYRAATGLLQPFQNSFGNGSTKPSQRGGPSMGLP